MTFVKPPLVDAIIPPSGCIFTFIIYSDKLSLTFKKFGVSKIFLKKLINTFVQE